MSYKVTRLYKNDSEARELLAEGLTRKEAQEMCSRSDTETSSSTCVEAEGIARTAAKGEWFNSFDEE